MSEAARQYLHWKLTEALDREAQQNLVLLFNLEESKAKELVFLCQKTKYVLFLGLLSFFLWIALACAKARGLPEGQGEGAQHQWLGDTSSQELHRRATWLKLITRDFYQNVDAAD